MGIPGESTDCLIFGSPMAVVVVVYRSTALRQRIGAAQSSMGGRSHPGLETGGIVAISRVEPAGAKLTAGAH